ncbi:hypothetical protein N7536_000620 [Penicillium majusculum]|nr:hypothetical protein N7536_000620 [Penicillium majusculum]
MRAAMNPFFSKGAADRAPIGFARRLNSASDIISQQSGERKRIDVVNVIRSLTCNTMADIFLGDPGLVPTGCRSDLLDTLDEIGSKSLLILNFPLLQYLGAKIPPCIANSLAPGLRGLREKCNTLIGKCQEKKNYSESFGGSGSVCEMILDKNPAGALSTAVDRDIMQHTLQFLVPNTDSSAMALSAAILELIKPPAMRHRLRGELNDYCLESDDWSSLTKLPYLAAVVKETLRMYPSLPGLLPRVVPAGGRTIGQHYLPQGTIIAVSIYAMHQNAEAYPEPTRFIPERWLINGDKERDGCFTPFQKGNNACIGINLAYMQLYLGIAHTVKRFDLALCESDFTDWDWIDRAGAKLARPVSLRVVQDYASAEYSRGSYNNSV